MLSGCSPGVGLRTLGRLRGSDRTELESLLSLPTSCYLKHTTKKRVVISDFFFIRVLVGIRIFEFVEQVKTLFRKVISWRLTIEFNTAGLPHHESTDDRFTALAGAWYVERYHYGDHLQWTFIWEGLFHTGYLLPHW